MCNRSYLLAQEDAVRPVGLVSGGLPAIIVNEGIFLRTKWNGVRQIPQSHADRVGTAVAEFHEPREAQGVSITGPRLVELLIIEDNLVIHEVE